MDEITLKLNSPITEEQWDDITDVDFDCTDRIWFHTKHGKDVEFVKQRKGKWIKAERRGCMTYSDAYAECSYCHGEPTYLGWKMNFCPNCGSFNGGEEGE